MQFATYFNRQKGAASTDPLLGSDATITVTSPKESGNGTHSPGCVVEFKRDGVNRLAVGYWYEGSGSVPSIPVTIWVWDELSQKYWQCDSGSLASGQITYFRIPQVAIPPQTSATLGQPSQGFHVLVIAADNAGPTGIYHFVAGADLARF